MKHFKTNEGLFDWYKKKKKDSESEKPEPTPKYEKPDDDLVVKITKAIKKAGVNEKNLKREYNIVAINNLKAYWDYLYVKNIGSHGSVDPYGEEDWGDGKKTLIKIKKYEGIFNKFDYYYTITVNNTYLNASDNIIQELTNVLEEPRNRRLKEWSDRYEREKNAKKQELRDLFEKKKTSVMKTNFEDFINEELWNPFQRKFDLSQYKRPVNPAAHQENDPYYEEEYEEDYAEFEEIRNFLFTNPKRQVYLKVDEKTYIPCFSIRGRRYRFHRDFSGYNAKTFNIAPRSEINRLTPISDDDLQLLTLSFSYNPNTKDDMIHCKNMFFNNLVNKVLNPNN